MEKERKKNFFFRKTKKTTFGAELNPGPTPSLCPLQIDVFKTFFNKNIFQVFLEKAQAALGSNLRCLVYSPTCHFIVVSFHQLDISSTESRLNILPILITKCLLASFHSLLFMQNDENWCLISLKSKMFFKTLLGSWKEFTYDKHWDIRYVQIYIALYRVNYFWIMRKWQFD